MENNRPDSERGSQRADFQYLRLPPAWQPLASDFLVSDAAAQLDRFLQQEDAAGQTVYPPHVSRFRALESVSPDEVRVVILGQDPYHGPGQAMGLSFSVPQSEPVPPSLRNMYEELRDDLGFAPVRHGNLSAWTRQGVLLLNTVLSVRAGEAGSHQGRGWESLTGELLRRLSERRNGLVFLLWGSHARRRGELIDASRHLLLEAPHPSPLSAYRGFFGCRHFSKANAYLHATGQTPVDWQLPDG